MSSQEPRPPRGNRPDHTHSFRLTFAYDGDDVRLVEVERLEMITPRIGLPGDEGPPADSPRAGYYTEVRDAQGELIHAQPLVDPLQRTREVFEPDGSIHRVDNPERKGRFEVLVPDLPGAEEFSLQGPPVGKAELEAQSEPLLRHSFGELRERGDARQGEDS